MVEVRPKPVIQHPDAWDPGILNPYDLHNDELTAPFLRGLSVNSGKNASRHTLFIDPESRLFRSSLGEY